MNNNIITKRAPNIGAGIRSPWLNALPTNNSSANTVVMVKNSLALANPLSSSITSNLRIQKA